MPAPPSTTRLPVRRSVKMTSADTRKNVTVQKPVMSSAVATSTKRVPPWTSTATCDTGAPACPGVTPAQNMSTNSETIAVRSLIFGSSTRPSTNMRRPPHAPSCSAHAAATTSHRGCRCANPSARSARLPCTSS